VIANVALEYLGEAKGTCEKVFSFEGRVLF
jgi:hypothetical protein